MENKVMQAYNDFMKWFKEKHPVLHERFEKNISIPLKEGDGVEVKEGFGISKEEHEMLLKAASSYYSTNGEQE